MEACKLTASREGRRIEFEIVPGKPVVLGRSRECQVVLPDPDVSRQHCRITAADGRLLVEDLGSSHGIVHRGQRVQMLEIELGDGFHLGHTFVRFDSILRDLRNEAAGAAAPQPPPPPPPSETLPLPRGPLTQDPAAAAAAALEATVGGQATAELPAGTQLGGFVIVRSLGRSDRCTVYEAQQASLQRRVALKVLNSADGRTGTEDRAAFLADVHANAALRDGAVVPVLEAGTVDGHCFAALELVDGPSLSASLVAAQRLHWRDLAAALADVAQALQRIHDQDHVHGAVKPGNVFALLRGGGRLADPRAGTTLRPRESTAYSAPELLRGDAVTTAADLYSLGCVAYAVLSGRPPYWGSPKQILEEQRARRPASLTTADPSIPRELDALVCAELLALDPADRPTSAVACRDALLALLAPNAPVANALPPEPIAPPRYVTPVQPIAEPDAARAPMRRQPSAAKSFAARLTADTIIFGMVTFVLLALLLAMKAATGFDLYAAFGIVGRGN